MKKTLKGISYCRVSTDEQYKNNDGSVRNDASPLSQKERCIDHISHISRKKGEKMEFLDHLVDLGYSGKNTDRPGFQKIRNLILSRSIDFIIATELSRISRSVIDFLDLIKICEENNVMVFIIGLDLDTSSPFGKFMVTQLVALAQFEREMTAHRVRENAAARLVRDGKINGASEILGLRRDPKKKGHFIPNQKELVVVEKIMNLFLELSSKQKVLNTLKKIGLKGRDQKPISMNSLTKILENAEWRYRGKWPANRNNKDKDQSTLSELKRYQIVDLPHGPVLSVELLERVTTKLKNTYENKKRAGKGHVYMLSQILKYEDGTSFQGVSAKGGQHRYYRNISNNIRIPIKKLDDLVLQRIKHYLADQEKVFVKMLEKSLKENESRLPEIKTKIDSLRKELDILSKEQDRIKSKLIKTDALTPSLIELLDNELASIDSQKISHEKQINLFEHEKSRIEQKSGLRDLKGKMKELLNGANKLTGVQKRALAEQIFKEIRIKSNNVIEFHIYRETQNTTHNQMEESLYSESCTSWHIVYTLFLGHGLHFSLFKLSYPT